MKPPRQKAPFLFRLLLGPALVVFSQFTLGQSGEEAETREEGDDAWLDTGHDYVTSQADRLAYWMNDFFGDVRTEEEAPYSTLRLRIDQEWDQEDRFDSDIKLRGKLHLPKLNKRLSLLFADDDTGDTDTDDLLISDQRDTPEDVTLQYEARSEERYRLDFRLGLRSSGYPKGSVRYRYRYPFSETLAGTFSEELLYLTDDGFASKTRIELDKVLSNRRLLEWNNKIDWEEDADGVDWASGLVLERRLSDKKAYAYFLAVNGRTDPDIVHNYAVGVRYRQNIFRPWLFAEVKPSYRWSKEIPGAPRENAFLILFRLEAVFKKDFGEGDD